MMYLQGTERHRAVVGGDEVSPSSGFEFGGSVMAWVFSDHHDAP